ncbi:nuclear pore complex protein Nup107 [Schistocerca americana]|uniref:nuclear pore complex protein Nup107 n=1 Tax=Schistocerca americana TaxID=7009 RepID=UPI001F4F1589|nr:nuclear pore complex protein Nup107 [Schistocerca americana]
MNISQNDILRTLDLLDQSVNISRKPPARERENVARKLLESFRKDHSEFSVLCSPHQRRGVTDLSVTLAQCDVTALHSTTIREESVYEVNYADSLYTLFLESLQQHATERRIFDIVLALIQNCKHTIQLITENWKRKRSKLSVEELSWLTAERNTWRLVYCLYQNRLSSHEREMKVGPPRKLSEKEIAEQLFENDPVIREYQLVVDWLEQNAADDNVEDRNKAVMIHYFTDKTVNWENTIHCLQNKEQDIPYSGPEDLVTEIDPDAPFRQKKKLHPLDEKDDSRLEMVMFNRIRSGCLDEAQLLCRQCGCFWRAVLLEGWRLYHDPNYDETPVDDETVTEKKPTEGNYRRDLWKLMTWQTIETKQLRPYMNGVLGAFCGHLKSLLEVSKTWADMLWSHMRVVVDIKVEKEIRAAASRKYEPMPEEYWANMKSVKEIFSELASSEDPSIKLTANEPMCVVQQMLIMDEIALLMEKISCWISSCDPQFLRFLAHLVLFFRMAGVSKRDDIGDLVLVEYIKVLIGWQQPCLVAYYASLLPQDDQITLYSEFLQKIVDPELQLQCLADGEDAGLDICAVTKTTVENIRRRADSELEFGLQHEETSQDTEKVNALNWLVVYPEQRFELLWQANAIIRQFIASGKLEIARKALNKIPGDTIDSLVREYNASETVKLYSYADVNTLLPAQVAETCREYLCISAYLDAEEVFSNWIEHFYNARPKPPAKPGVHANFAEKVAFEQRENIYKAEMERWRTIMLQQTKAVKDKLMNILTFPSGGWMVDSGPLDRWEVEEDAIEEINLRKQQMDCLRQLCIPKVVLLLHTLHHKMGDYRECIQLADLVVDEHYGLYKVYTTEGLQDLLAKICESSLELLHQKKDPWGLPVTS